MLASVVTKQEELVLKLIITLKAKLMVAKVKQAFTMELVQELMSNNFHSKAQPINLGYSGTIRTNLDSTEPKRLRIIG